MTIYALSTGPGISGIAIVRVSGEDTKKVIKLITNTTNIKFSEEQIKKSIEESSFENLQKLEDEKGFI